MRRDYSFFTCSSVDGHSGDFHVPAVVDRAAVNAGARVYFEILISVHLKVALPVSQ